MPASLTPATSATSATSATFTTSATPTSAAAPLQGDSVEREAVRTLQQGESGMLAGQTLAYSVKQCVDLHQGTTFTVQVAAPLQA